jgi:NADH-quinone oxidoreductase subunit A
MILSTYALVGLVGFVVLGGVLLAVAVWHPPVEEIEVPGSWMNYRFGFAIISLIFVAFDMEMIFMYPWAVVFAKVGMKAFLDMFMFIGLLSAGIAYAWAMGGLEWE